MRVLAVVSALVSFYVTYLAYRNLKSVVPLLRPDELFDGRLGDLDRSLFAGSDPADVLHSVLGSGISAHALSGVYEVFFLFIPLALAFALVVLPNLRAGLFLTTALAINWMLAAGSYFLLPSLGPIYAESAQFAGLPSTGVSGLQQALLEQRMEFLRDPSVAGTAQSIGAFASLHVSIFFTAALATHLLGLARYVKIAVWVLFALTVAATVYFGWHYVLDDFAGLAIAVTALALARAIIGIDLRALREAAGGRLMASRTLLEPGREARRRPGAARPVASPRRRRGGAWCWPGRSSPASWSSSGCSPPTRRASRCAIPTTSPRSTSCWSASASSCSSGSTSPCARPGARARAARHGRRWPRCGASAGPRRGRSRRAPPLVSFYVSYMAYRNLKAIVPLLRPDDIFDRQLADLDRSMFLGHDPAELLHSALGVGVPTHILSTFYAAFIVFLPLSLAVALVFSRDIRAGLFYATALSVNWVLGAASYFLLPSLGPIYYEPKAFSHLPHSEVTRLQDMLLDQRVEFLIHPTTATPQSIAAFASLHISMSLTAVLAAHLLGLGKRLKIGLWIWLGMTTLATVYFGWHYFLDDLGGIVIAVGALAVARLLTGIDLRALRVTPRSARPAAD